MPVVHVRLRWPDGVEQRVYSPSLVVTERLTEGRSYDVDDILPLVRSAWHEASERVRASYGFPCSRSAAALAAMESRAADVGSGVVVVEAFER